MSRFQRAPVREVDPVDGYGTARSVRCDRAHIRLPAAANRGAAAAKGDSGADRQGSTDADRQGIRAAPEDDGAATAQGLDAAERQSGIVGSSWAAYQGRAVEGKPVQNDEGGRE